MLMWYFWLPYVLKVSDDGLGVGVKDGKEVGFSEDFVTGGEKTTSDAVAWEDAEVAGLPADKFFFFHNIQPKITISKTAKIESITIAIKILSIFLGDAGIGETSA